MASERRGAVNPPALLSADPAAVESAAQALDKAGASQDGLADRVPTNLSENIWSGEAKKAFGEAAKRQADRLRLGAGAHKAGARAIHAYAQALRDAQRQTQTAYSTYLRADQNYRALRQQGPLTAALVNAINGQVEIANKAVASLNGAIQQVNAAAAHLNQELHQAAQDYT
jgi:uncharacterized phage infection (PIP) family protein YhgE